MAVHHLGVVGSAVTSVAAMVVVLVLGVIALAVVRWQRRDDEPLFPDLERARTPQPDPAAFTEQLAAGGTVADDVTRVGDVAAASGFQQAYALLALVDDDGSVDAAASRPTIAPVRDEQPTTAPDPYAALTDVGTPDSEDERALTAFVDGPRDVPIVESADTLLPRARTRRLRSRTA
ncbi:MAG TPA: hypothetical protein VFC33_15605 [Acidimicrobiia bacterium]|nr:hypothetical protein [Acidimicrobiia bacterium]